MCGRFSQSMAREDYLACSLKKLYAAFHTILNQLAD